MLLKIATTLAKPPERRLWRIIETMHARPDVKQILIANKMKRWHAIVRWPMVDRTCPTQRARRNFLRLLARYPEIGKKLGLTVTSVFRY
jgi:hypothetical protein